VTNYAVGEHMAFGVRIMKHIQLEPARIMSYKSNQIISDSLEAKIEAQTKTWTKYYWTF
jgi:hypothetical protein